MDKYNSRPEVIYINNTLMIWCALCKQYEPCVCETEPYCSYSCKCNRKKVVNVAGRMEEKDFQRYFYGVA